MATVLSTILTAYRAALVTATFVNLPENQDIDDLPATKIEKTFSLVLLAHRPITGQGGVFGGGNMDYEADCKLEIHWRDLVDSEAVHNTIADDLLAASLVMLAASNRQAGQLTTFLPNAGFAVQPVSAEEMSAVGTFTVRFRETQNLL